MFPSLERRITELEKTVNVILEELCQIKNQRVEQDEVESSDDNYEQDEVENSDEEVEIDGVVESSDDYDNDYEEADNDRDSSTSTTSNYDDKPEASKIQIIVHSDSASTSSYDESSENEGTDSN